MRGAPVLTTQVRPCGRASKGWELAAQAIARRDPTTTVGGFTMGALLLRKTILHAEWENKNESQNAAAGWGSRYLWNLPS
jgi:hypothetical protein